MVDILINRKPYGSGEISDMVSDFSNLCDWDRIDTTTVEGETRFYIGKAYLCIRPHSSNINYPVISLFMNDIEISESSIGGNTYYVHVHAVKNANSIVVLLRQDSSRNADMVYGSTKAFVIGDGTNVVTGEKETVISFIGQPSLNIVSRTSNVGLVCSSEVTETSFSLTTVSPYYYSKKYTLLYPIVCLESQVMMNNVYLVNRCSLDTPSLGECTLAGKKFYMAFNVWIPID